MKPIRWRRVPDFDRYEATVDGTTVYASCMTDHHARWWDVADATRTVVVRHQNRNAAARAVAAADAVLP